jgi:hypothetical protein
MSADIIQFVPKPNLNRPDIPNIAALPTSGFADATAVMNQCFPSWPGGIDDLVLTTSIEIPDGIWDCKLTIIGADGTKTSREWSEVLPYIAPDKDSA